MKKVLWGIGGAVLLLVITGCVSNQTTRRLNALYEKVNEMQTDMVGLEDKIDEINERLRDIQGPPVAELQTMQENVEYINELYVGLAEEIIQIQERLGMTPMETLPATFK